MSASEMRDRSVDRGKALNFGYSRSGGYGPRRRATGTRHTATTG